MSGAARIVRDFPQQLAEVLAPERAARQSQIGEQGARLEETGGGLKLSVPHIRLDRALQYLIGDRLA